MGAQVFLVGVACGLERYSHATLLNMLVVTVGVMLASMGEVHFDPPGFLMLFASLACEAMRLALVQLFLQVQVNSRTSCTQGLKCSISLCTNPVPISSVPIQTVR